MHKTATKIEQLDLCQERIYNAGEFGSFWRCLSEKTLIHVEEKCTLDPKVNKYQTIFMPSEKKTRSRKLLLLKVFEKLKNLRPSRNLVLSE